MDIKGLSIIVTGGGSGMGAETARHLAKAGAKVAVLDLNKANADAVAKEIGGVAFECDVSNEASAKAAIDGAIAANGPLRVLMNCAGIAPAARIVGKEGPHDLGFFSKIINVNLIGTFNMLRLAAAAMSTLAVLRSTSDGTRSTYSSSSGSSSRSSPAAMCRTTGPHAVVRMPGCHSIATWSIGWPKP